MNKLPYYFVDKIYDKSTIDVNIQLFKTNQNLNRYLSRHIFKDFRYTDDNIRMLERYGKFIQIIDKLKDIENDYKHLPNIKRIYEEISSDLLIHY